MIVKLKRPAPLPEDVTMKRTEIAENKISRYARRGALVACLLTTLPAMGCRSGKPGWSMFGRSGEPSAATLAGSGPTSTYPVPPSSRARPESIASIAGGTAPSGGTALGSASVPSQTGAPTSPSGPPAGANPYALAGNRGNSFDSGVPTGFPTGAPASNGNNPAPTTSFAANPNSASGPGGASNGVPPAYALPGRSAPAVATSSGSPAPNQAASVANGYPAPSPNSRIQNTSPSTPPSAATLPNGYQLGQKTPPASGNGSGTAVAANPSGGANQSAKPAFEMPPLNSLTPSRIAADSSGPDASRSAGPPAGGFTLPSNMLPPASSTASTPIPAANQPAAASTALTALNLPPVNSQPASGASTPLGNSSTMTPEFQTAAAGNTSPEGTPDAGSVQPAGYMPGSTSKASGYPTGPTMMR